VIGRLRGGGPVDGRAAFSRPAGARARTEPARRPGARYSSGVRFPVAVAPAALLVLAVGAAGPGCGARVTHAASASAPADPPGLATATGPTFRVVCHFPDARVARTALQLAETAAHVADEVWGTAVPGRAAPLELHLYRTMQDFDRAAEVLTHRTNHDNLNFFVGERLQSHVLVQPLLSEEAMGALGLPLLTKSLIAFQAAQLLRAARAPGWSLQPAWYAAGLGKWVALRTLRAAGAMADPMTDPLWSSNIHDLQQLQRRLPAPAPDNTIESVAYWTDAATPFLARAAPRNTHLPLPSEVLARDLSGSLTQNEFFGLAWLMFETLMTPPFASTTRALVAELQALPAPDGPLSAASAAAIARGGGLKRVVASRLAERAMALFGPDQLSLMDAAFERALAAQRPRWSEETRSLDAQGRDWVQIAFPQSLRASRRAAAWSLDRIPGASFAISGRALMLPNFGRQMNVFLELDGDQFLQVSFTADDGVWFWLFDRARGSSRDGGAGRDGGSGRDGGAGGDGGSGRDGGSWIDRRHLPVPGIAIGTPFAFRIVHAGEIVTVELGGRLVARLPLDKPANGRWGLGVQEGTAAIWSDVRATPLGAR